jgi:hypothetical protein
MSFEILRRRSYFTLVDSLPGDAILNTATILNFDDWKLTYPKFNISSSGFLTKKTVILNLKKMDSKPNLINAKAVSKKIKLPTSDRKISSGCKIQ